MKPQQKTKLKTLEQQHLKNTTYQFPSDPIEFCTQILNFQPTTYQTQLIQQFTQNQFTAARWARQTGKSHTVSALLLHNALTHPNTNTAIVGPSWRQTKLIIKRINTMLNKLPKGTTKNPKKPQ